MIEFNINSNDHLSVLFFGGSIKAPLKIPNGETKKGVVKFKKVSFNWKTLGLGVNGQLEWKNKKGLYFTNEKVLNVLSKGKGDVAKLAHLLLEIRGLNKLLSTYYDGLEDKIYPDNCVHATFCHVLTPTGRLNCSNPNIQNQPKPPTEVTKHFTSRYKYGKLIAADYSQIDVRAEAEQCKDWQYTYDILNRDSHTKNLALMMNVDYEEADTKVKTGEWKELRSKAKGITFSQQYLAAPMTTARAAGISVDKAKAIIEARKREYPDLYRWHERNRIEVEKTGSLNSITGRKYKFKKWPPSERAKKYGFGDSYSINDIANYPTQGLATGDIALIMFGKFWREKAIHNREKYLIINTVHDNIILDCKLENVEQAKKDLKVLENWKDVCYNYFKYDWEIDLTIETKVGDSWYECF